MDISIIKDIRETLNLTREEFADSLDITIDSLNTWEYRNKRIPQTKEKRIKMIFSSFFTADEISAIPENNYTMVEFYDLEEISGKIEFGTIALLPENRKRLVPKRDDNGNYLVVRVSGHSMDDNTKRSICDGDEIFIREYDDCFEKLPIHNKLFVIVTENGVFIKQILTNRDPHITCHSFNIMYADFSIAYKDIEQIFTVENKVRSSIMF